MHLAHSSHGSRRTLLVQPMLSTILPDSKTSLREEESTVFEECLLDGWVEPKEFSLNHVKNVPNAFYIDNVLTNEECDRLRGAIDSSGSLSFWSTVGREDEKARAFRNADTIEVDNLSICTKIWSRIDRYVKSLTLSFAELDDGTENWKVDLPGIWSPDNLNKDLLFAKYPSSGSFSPHTDGNAVHSFNYRSFFSVIIFLNTIPDGAGGGTKFYQQSATSSLVFIGDETRWSAPSELCLGEVLPVAGRFLLFDQTLVHEGVPPSPPFEKYIIRSDIMSIRTPAVCDSPEDQVAYELFRRAEMLSEKGQVDESIVLFRRAFKLSPALAVMLGQG